MHVYWLAVVDREAGRILTALKQAQYIKSGPNPGHHSLRLDTRLSLIQARVTLILANILLQKIPF